MHTRALSARNATDAGVARILVVDDDAALGRSLARIITEHGGSATIVGTVSAAMEQIAKSPSWTALILDERLPDGSGLDILRAFRAADARVPALILTGHVAHDLPGAAFELRAAYLVKPAKPSHVEQFVQLALDVGQLRGSPEPRVDDSLPNDLRDLAADVVRANRQQRTARAEYDYRLALFARAANCRTWQGRSVMEPCAKAIGVSRSTLHEYTSVTTRWDADEVRYLLTLRDSHGRAVTIHHLLLVVRAPRALRSELERIIRQNEDIREMQSFLQTSRAKAPSR